jgi:iron complex outermembrane receptor protein
MEIAGDPAYRRMFEYRAIDGRVQARYVPLEWLNLRLGADYSFESHRVLYYRRFFRENDPDSGIFVGDEMDDGVTSDDVLNADLSNVGVDAEAAVRSSRLRLSGNVRVDLPGNIKPDGMAAQDLYGEQLSFRIALAARATQRISAKLIAGQAFQIPSASLLFALPGQGLGTENVIGNRTDISLADDLNPQSVVSAETQVSVGFDIGVLEASVYVQEVRDRIVFETLGLNYEATNVEDKQRSVGGELSSLVSVVGIFPYLRLGVHKIISSGGNPVLETVPFPVAHGVIGVDLPLGETPVSANAEVVHVRERGSSQANTFFNNNQPYDLDPYTEINLALGTRGFASQGEGMQTKLYVAVKNLLDDQHSEPGFTGFDLPTLGRRILFEVRQTF